MSGTIYVYAVTKAEAALSLELPGIDDRPLERVECGDLAVITSLARDPAIAPSKEKALHHHEVVAALSAIGTTLPVRFGTTFPDRQALVSAVEGLYPQLLDSVQRLAGTVEFGVTSFWETASVDDQRCGSSEPNWSGPAASGSDYMHRRLREYRRHERLRQRAQSVAADLSSQFGDLILDSDEQILPSPDVPVRASYLIAAERATELRAAFDEARTEVSDVRIVLSGPWPPYSFTATGLQSPPVRDIEGNSVTRI